MILVVLLTSVLVSYVLVWLFDLFARSTNLRIRWTNLRADHANFRRATTDAERQRFLIQVGLKTLSVSLILFIACSVLCLIAFLPLWVFDFDSAEEFTYIVITTVASLFFLKRNGTPSF